MNATPMAGEPVDDVGDTLAIAYLRLHRAAAIAHHLDVTNPSWRARPGWDLSLAIHEAISGAESAARSFALNDSHDFWKQPLGPAAVAAANSHATMPTSALEAVDLLVNHLGAALNSLIGADQHNTEAGTVDAALHAICDALRAATSLPATDRDDCWEVSIQ